uniref:Ig-like domain-containing protein n=1 Tax=Denticeps clupeoides TaxID=299321 RepID=A0AAY4CAX7_9TELE
IFLFTDQTENIILSGLWRLNITFTLSLDLPTAQLNVESKWTKVFSTESVVMKCEIQPSSTDWRYKWYRNGQEVPDPTNGNKYSISRTNKEHSGEYTCQGVHSIRTVATGGSNVIQLTVDGKYSKHYLGLTCWEGVLLLNKQ